jgi:hypothetical protein
MVRSLQLGPYKRLTPDFRSICFAYRPEFVPDWGLNGGKSMKKMVCELCGSNEFTKDDDGMFVCDYCKTKYTASQAKSLMVEGTVKIDRSEEVEKLVFLSRKALDHENHAESFECASKALEIDRSNSEAWYLKGASSGWTTTLVDSHLPEMVGSFTTAVQNANDSEKAELKARCSDQMNRIAVAVHTLSLNHATEFPQVDSTWADHIARCAGIVSALGSAYEMGGEREPLDNIVTIYSQLITGISYTDLTGANAVHFLTPEYQALVQAEIDRASELLKKFDPDYSPPKPEPLKPSACFVVTATVGSESAQPVVLLRRFRDELLTVSSLGNKFIDWYYKNGPKIADLIRDEPLLRMLSFIFVVAPATSLAWASLKIREAIEK